MKFLKLILLAGLGAMPVSAAVQAADIDSATETTTENNEALGLYLRSDVGWSFLEWSGGSDDDALSVGAGIGYQFNNNLRSDITLDWAGDYDVAPGADMSTTTVLGNLYFDWSNDTPFTPYVGAGLGYGWVDDSPTGDEDGFAYGLTAGVSMGLSDKVDLDVGYRFRDTMISGADPQEHQISAGVRFAF